MKCGPETTAPAISIVPCSTAIKPAIARSNVVLPQPETADDAADRPGRERQRGAVDDRCVARYATRNRINQQQRPVRCFAFSQSKSDAIIPAGEIRSSVAAYAGRADRTRRGRFAKPHEMEFARADCFIASVNDAADEGLGRCTVIGWLYAARWSRCRFSAYLRASGAPVSQRHTAAPDCHGHSGGAAETTLLGVRRDGWSGRRWGEHRLVGRSLRFPRSPDFEWALLLPLAMPAYIVAYAYTDYLQYSRSAADCVARQFRLAARRLLVSRNPVADRGGVCLHLRAVSVCVSACTHCIPGADGGDDGCGAQSRTRPRGKRGGASICRWHVRRLPRVRCWR